MAGTRFNLTNLLEHHTLLPTNYRATPLGPLMIQPIQDHKEE